MLKKAIAVIYALTAFSSADAALLEYGYTFKDGRSISGTLYGDVTADGSRFLANGSRFYSRSKTHGVFEGSTLR